MRARMLCGIFAAVLLPGCALMQKPMPPMPDYHQSLEPALGCDPFLWKHTYHQFRFRSLPGGECIRVTGIVRMIHYNSMDGDLNLEIEPDEQYRKLLNSAGPGLLRSEVICQRRPNSWMVRPACSAVRKNPQYQFPVPPIGAHVELIGRLVADCFHNCHTELHPVSRLTILPPS